MLSKALLAFLGFLTWSTAIGVAAAADPLGPYRGKNRLLVLYVPEPPRGKKVLASWEAVLRQETSRLVDRDLLVFHAGPIPGKSPGYAVPLTVTERKELCRRLGLGGSEPQVILIGKDGTVKRRQTSERLDLAGLFALIDTMPMRQEEMRRKDSARASAARAAAP